MMEAGRQGGIERGRQEGRKGWRAKGREAERETRCERKGRDREGGRK